MDLKQIQLSDVYHDMGTLLIELHQTVIEPKVYEILNKNIDLLEKYNEIRVLKEKLDLNYLPTNLNYHKSLEDTKKYYNSRIITTQDLQLPKQNSILSWFFREYKLINRFERQTNFIRVGFFTTRIKLTKTFHQSWDKNFLPKLYQIVKMGNFFLKRGWYYLNKKDYNLVASFFNAVLWMKKNLNVSLLFFKNFSAMEQLVKKWAIFANREVLEKIIFILDKFYTQAKFKKDDIDFYLEDICFFMGMKGNIIENILTALLIHINKKYYYILDIKNKNVKLTIGMDYFAIPDKYQNEYRTYISSVLNRLQNQLHEYWTQKSIMRITHEQNENTDMNKYFAEYIDNIMNKYHDVFHNFGEIRSEDGLGYYLTYFKSIKKIYEMNRTFFIDHGSASFFYETLEFFSKCIINMQKLRVRNPVINVTNQEIIQGKLKSDPYFSIQRNVNLFMDKMYSAAADIIHHRLIKYFKSKVTSINREMLEPGMTQEGWKIVKFFLIFHNFEYQLDKYYYARSRAVKEQQIKHFWKEIQRLADRDYLMKLNQILLPIIPENLKHVS